MGSTVAAPSPARRAVGASGPLSTQLTTGEFGAPSATTQAQVATMLRYRVGFAWAVTLYAGFFVTDVFMVHFVAPGRLWVYAALRFSGVGLGILFWWRLRRAPPLSWRMFRFLDVGIYCYATISITLMALESGGLTSIYLNGIVTAVVFRGATLAEHWRSAVVSLGVPVLAYFATLAIATGWSETLQTQWRSPHALAIFAVTTMFLFAALFFVLFAGHGTWALQQQVFEARRLGRYRLIQPLGEGGMGQVWVAAHSTLRRHVAVKILRPASRRDPLLASARFEREVRATTELTHPNTVRIFDYGVTEDGLSYYVMELLAGDTLRRVVERDGPLVLPRVVHIGLQIARSLAEAHAHGIVHRDVKPDNIMLCSLGGEADVVKVIDFGIAHLRSTDDDLTATGIAIGTPAYMPPEVRAGGSADESADVYGLGGVLYFLLRGVDPPRDGLQDTTPLVDVDERLATLVARCLAPHPAARVPTMAQVIAELAAIERRSPVVEAVA
jgi:serine/threonine-protein kinase